MPTWCRAPALALSLAAGLAVPASAQDAGPATFSNPLPVEGPTGPVESCADPSVIADPEGGWVMFCTTDPLSDADRDAGGDLVFRLLPTFRSPDLVHWTYAGDAFDRAPGGAPPPPAWADPTAVLWAPDIARLGDRYLLTFAVTDAVEEAGGEPDCDEDSAIGLALSDSPLGPWEPMEEPLVAPRRAGEGCEFFWTLDPEVIDAGGGEGVLYYGSFYGGIEARPLLPEPDGRWTAPAAMAAPVTIPNRYEGAEVVEHEGRFYLFGSATNCCAGPQTGYAVFVGAASDPFGPFIDRDGVPLLAGPVGGTPVLAQNGNGWVGPGHNTLVQDAAGQWWTLYHAIEEAAPWYAGAPGFTRRPVLLDRLDWVEGWPVVNGGAGPSTDPQPAPATAPGDPLPPPDLVAPDRLGDPLPDASDAFDGPDLDPAWTWLRDPPEGLELADGRLRWSTQDADLWEDRDDASVLTRPLPEGDLAVELRVRLLPVPQGCCQNYVQAGLVLMGSDDAYIKLVLVSIWETRQTEFARELPPPQDAAPRYGNTVVGPPGEDWTWLRVVVRRGEDGDLFTPWTSRDGVSWVRGGAWTHDLGPDPRIGLVGMGAAGFSAEFDDLQVRPLLP